MLKKFVAGILIIALQGCGGNSSDETDSTMVEQQNKAPVITLADVSISEKNPLN